MFDDIFSRLDRIPAWDGETDRQTSWHGIVRAMHTRRAVKPIVPLALSSRQGMLVPCGSANGLGPLCVLLTSWH